MAGGIKGITVEIGGDTTKLGKALEGVNGKTKSLQSELKGVNTLLKMDPGNVTLLAQKQDILTQAISETTTKLGILKDAQSQVQKQFENGEIGAEQYRDFQREIIATENKLQKLTSELDEIDNSVSDIEKTEDAVNDLGDEAEDSSEGFTIMKGALADMVADGIQNAISAVGDLVGQLFELSEATEEFRTMQGKLSGSAESFGYSADFASGKFQEFYKYMNDEMGATNAITNLMGIGTSVESVSKLAEGAIGVWASYGDSIPIESLTESINETIQVGKVTGTMADTINWAKTANEELKAALDGNTKAQSAFNKAIKDGETAEDAFNAALEKVTDAQERADIVAKFLNSTYGESKRTYDEMNGSITSAHEAQLRLTETQARLGETIAPVTSEFTNFKAQALDVISPLVEKLASGLMKLLTWLKAHPGVCSVVTSSVTALATAFGVLAGAMAIQAIINGVTKAMTALNITILSNPYLLAAAALAGLVAGLVIFTATTKEAQTETQKMCDEMDELNDTIAKNASAYAEAKKAREEAMQGTEHEYAHYQQLLQELESITDENGKVISGYENRANVITGILSDALGREITTDQLVAQGKQNVIDKINQLILTKKAEIQLSANESAYAEAVKNSTEAVNTYMTAKQNAEKVTSELAVAEQELKQAHEENKYLLERGTVGADAAYAANMAEARQKVYDLTQQQKENNKALEDAQTKYLGYQTTIKNYEGLSSAIIEGDTTKINEAVTNLVNNFITAELGTKTSLENQVKNAKEILQNLKTALAEGTPGVTQQMVDDAQNLVDRATAELNKLVDNGKEVGEKSGGAVADGVKSKIPEAEISGTKVVKSVKKGAVSVDASSAGASKGAEIVAGVNAKQGEANVAGQNVATNAKKGAESVDSSSAGTKFADVLLSGVNQKQPLSQTTGKTLADMAKAGAATVDATSTGNNFGQGFANGISQKSNTVWTVAWTLASHALSSLKQRIQEGSPSKLTKKSGGFFGEGFAIGIKDSTPKVLKSVENLVDDTKKAFLGKDGFDIHSPSRYMEDEVGKQLVAGLISGVKKEKNNAKKSAQELAKLYISETENTIKKKRDFYEIAIGDEIFLWKTLLAQFKKGSDEYKSVELKLLEAHEQYVEDCRDNNTMSLQDSKTYWESLLSTVDKNSVLYKGILNVLAETTEEINEDIKKTNESFVSDHEAYVSKKRKYLEMSAEDEIAYWTETLKQCEKGSDNYKEIELKLLDAHQRHVEEMCKNNDISVQDEISYWSNVLKTCEEGSNLYLLSLEKFNEGAKKYEDTFVAENEKTVEERKKNNKMSLAGEVQYWSQLLKQAEKGSKNYTAIYDKMNDAGKRLLEESSNLQTQFLADTQVIKDRLINDIQSVTDEYDRAVNDRKKQIVSSMGLFDAFTKNEGIDKFTLLDNLESQVDALKEWDNTLDALSKRKGMKNSELLKDLQGMGVDSLGTLQQINSMSDEELGQYLDFYSQKNRIAMERAVTENESLRIESERQIADLTAAANRELNALERTYVENLEEIGLSTADQSKKIGHDIVNGLISGINAETPNLQNFLTQFFNSIVTTAQDALEVHSPSRIFRNVIGKQIPAGIAVGISENSKVAHKAITDLSNDLVKEANHIDGATITRKLNTTFSAKIGNGQTLTDVMETMINCTNKLYDRLNRLQVVLDSDVLVGETIDKIDAGLANRQILTARGL